MIHFVCINNKQIPKMCQHVFYPQPNDWGGGGGEDIVLALAFLSITLFCPDAYLGNGFSDFIILYHEGDIVLALSVLSILPFSVLQSVYGLRKVDLRRIVKSLASYHWPSGKAVNCLQNSEESTGYGTQVDP